MTETTYSCTIMEPDGRVIGVVECEVPVRFFHMWPDAEFETPLGTGVAGMATDDPDPEGPTLHRVTYARVGSAVWLGDGGEGRFALYQRVVA